MLAEYTGFFSRNGLGQFGFRWLHILAGITWIGLLYYFNLVQVPAFAAYGDEAKARNIALDRVARRALWWFRWAAVGTAVTGILITIVTKHYFDAGEGYSWGKIGGNIAISTGVLIGLIMLANVWGVIWRNQKVVLANAANLINGGQADPDAAAAGRRAFMASRTNTVLSVSMLFFMVFRSHHPYADSYLSGGKMGAYWLIALIVIAVIELNGLGLLPWKTQPNQGLNKMFENVRNTIIAAFGVWAIFLILTEVLFKP